MQAAPDNAAPGPDGPNADGPEESRPIEDSRSSMSADSASSDKASGKHSGDEAAKGQGLPPSLALKPPCQRPERAEPGTPIYLHLPFCATKCPYCDFFSVAAEGQDIDGMVEHIVQEIRERAPERPATVFLGGGTPSLLNAKQLERVLNELDRVTDFRSTAHEVTAECNPESLDVDKARVLLDLGVRRLSIGLQSLRNDALKTFGRVHDAAEGLAAYAAARKAGADAVSVDLIYAYPGQTLASWEQDLATILALEPDHLSAYNLTYEENTPFKRWLEEGKLSQLHEDLELDLFLTTREACSAAGLKAYEVSNYAPDGQQCAHNINYWENGPYVGIGPGAVSRVGPVRFGNPRALAAYRRWITNAGHATAWDERLDPASRLAETWWLGLRLAKGLEPARARRTAGFTEDEDPAIPIAEGFESSGHLERLSGSRGEDRWRLTEKGLPLADAIASKFLDRINAT
jgi:oxygen-independent coproporphyrinogen III oxidase